MVCSMAWQIRIRSKGSLWCDGNLGRWKVASSLIGKGVIRCCSRCRDMKEPGSSGRGNLPNDHLTPISQEEAALRYTSLSGALKARRAVGRVRRCWRQARGRNRCRAEVSRPFTAERRDDVGRKGFEEFLGNGEAGIFFFGQADGPFAAPGRLDRAQLGHRSVPVADDNRFALGHPVEVPE